MDIEKLINAKETYEAALERYQEEKELFMPKANEIAELFKSLDMSLMTTSVSDDIDDIAGYELCTKSTFKTDNDSRGLYDNKISLCGYNRHITCSCKDYEDDELGYYRVAVQDFMRDDWQEYFTKIVEELQKEKLAQKVANEYNDYLKLKEKFETQQKGDIL